MTAQWYIGMAGDSVIPVSYTHLDVYKRQVSLLVGSSGCDKTDPPIPDDGNDLSVKPADLSHGHTDDMAMNGADMATSGGDMAMGAADMTSTGPKVTGLPSCTDTGVTADTVFNAVAKTSCAMGRCHSTGAGYLPFTDGATMKSVMVGKKSSQSMLNVVTAGNVDQSYLIYKLMDQHLEMCIRDRDASLHRRESRELAN